ncbi:hypothetical protein WA026_019102 [Henosepilachna vigintioctopunctata]|uniref:Uncharacterized protein n=1 Tax=Henosepilachna vigintioctopunctata TaxID=420089 RepID=A0AAW1VAT3_9CUCU
MAFFDSVSVIAGRAVVTIENQPEKTPIVQQPRLSYNPPTPPPLKNRGKILLERSLSQSAPDIIENQTKEVVPEKSESPNEIVKKLEIPVLASTKSDIDIIKPMNNSLETVKSAEDLSDKPSIDTLQLPTVQMRKKSLMERRMSKSLYLRIECIGDQCREIPIIRQNSMPKFYLGSPEDHQIETAVFRTPSTVLTSPVPVTNQHGFVYDLSSVVQIEKEKAFSSSVLPSLQDRGRSQFRDKKIKLRRIKSTMSAFHINHM